MRAALFLVDVRLLALGVCFVPTEQVQAFKSKLHGKPSSRERRRQPEDKQARPSVLYA
jgi:hypothetical protein